MLQLALQWGEWIVIHYEMRITVIFINEKLPHCSYVFVLQQSSYLVGTFYCRYNLRIWSSKNLYGITYIWLTGVTLMSNLYNSVCSLSYCLPKFIELIKIFAFIFEYRESLTWRTFSINAIKTWLFNLFYKISF